MGLPRPVVVPASVKSDTDDEIEQLLQEEYMRLLKHDTIKYPVVGSKVAPGAVSLGDLDGLEEEFDRATLEDARKELDQEIRRIHDIPEDTDIKSAVWHLVSNSNAFGDIWESTHGNMLFSAKHNRFVPASEFESEQDKAQGMAKTIEVRKRERIKGKKDHSI